MVSDSEIIVQVRDVHKQFGGVRALDGVSLTVRAGEISCLVGENGSGKSTLIKTVTGVLRPDSGVIVFNGKGRSFVRPIEAIHHGIQAIYQDLSLFPNLTVAENLAINSLLARGKKWLNWSQVRRIAGTALQQIGVKIDPSAEIAQLPVAERQLVAVARALLQRARLIIMDEPTTALTRREVRTLFTVMRQLQSGGMAFLFVSHHLQDILQIGDSATVLRNGRVAAAGRCSRFDAADLARHMIGRPFPENARTRPPVHPAADAGQLLKEEDISSGAPEALPLLAVKGLGIPGRFQEIEFDLGRGEILGLTGLLGCGLRELGLSLFGLAAAKRGRILLQGREIRIRSVRDAVANGIAYLPEDRLTEGLFLSQSVERNIAAANLVRLCSRWGWLRSGVMRALANHWLGVLSISAPSPLTAVANLSGGNQQKVVLAKWLATRARILILNGPTVGVDVGARAEIHHEIQRLAKQGMGILLISNDIPELLALCSRILLMHRGRIVERISPQASRGETDLYFRMEQLA